jgi:dodecin
MADHVYKKIEVVGSSPEGVEQAIRNAVKKTGETVRNMRWLEMKEIRGQIHDGDVAHWQVTIQIGFTLD